jgi:type IV pilus assembly protein PilO
MALGLNKMPWYGQVLLMLVISAGSIFAFHYFYADDKEALLVTKEAELTRLQGVITRGNAIALQLPKFQAEVLQLEARLDGLKQVLPELRDVGDMLRRIQTLAAQSNLNVRTFKPQLPVNKELHAEWPMSIEFDGTYHNLGLFFDRVAKVPRIINISGIDIKAKPERDIKDADTGETISAQCLATTFVLIDKPADDPKAKGAKGKKTPAAPANKS